jgi:hypothetical protein
MRQSGTLSIVLGILVLGAFFVTCESGGFFNG